MLEADQISEMIITFLNKSRKLLNVPENTDLGKETALFGTDGILDSIGLIHLIVFLEKNLKAQGHPKITLVSSKTMSAKSSPFQNIHSLSLFIVDKIKQ